MADPDDFARLDSLLESALDHPRQERVRYIAEVCGDDTALRQRLERLVALAEGGSRLAPGGGLQGSLWEDLAREIGGEEPAPQRGQRLGRYELRDLLGVGGMGRVYRAFDPTLQREVAIKALSSLAAGPELHRRLEREARLLATLNHPNIAAIHGLEEIGGAPYLVLELVEGHTLAERLDRGPLALGEAKDVALQVTLALEAAHRKGVVHRDLKPSNVKLSPEGRVKVLDFGIAKPVARGADEKTPQSPTATVTRAGAALGTAPYMSPEQARGEPVDTRTDIWAFGCLLYEMLTGEPAFRGTSRAETMAAVLRDEVDWGRLPHATPQAIRRLLRRCLRRDLKERLQDIGDARLELSEPEADGEVGVGRAPSRRSPLPWIVAAALLAGLVGAWIGRTQAPPPSRRIARLSLELPEGFAIPDDYATPFAVSPDGTRLVVLATRGDVTRLYRRDVATLETTPIAGTEDAWQPFFSPDGREVAFFADRKLKKVPLDGGPVLTLAEVGSNPRGGAWSADGTIVLAPTQTSGLVRVSAAGGPLVPLTEIDLSRGEGSHRWPAALPGSRWVLFTTGAEDATYEDARLEAVSLATGERRVVLQEAAHGRSAGGRLFYAHTGRLFAVPFDARTLEVRGAPEVALPGVRYEPQNGGTQFAVSEGGTLMYVPALQTSPELYLALIDERGELRRIGENPRRFREPRLSPDGQRIAVVIGSPNDSDLWVLDTRTTTASRVSFGLSPHRPAWTPDGRGITIAAEQEGRWKLLTLPASGSAAPLTVFEGANRMYPDAWTPDGRFLVFQERRPGSGWDLRLLEAGGTIPRDLAATPFQETNAAISHDGRWLAYESDEADAVVEVYVAPLQHPESKVWVTVQGARSPRWDGRGRLYHWHTFAKELRRILGHGEGSRFVVERSESVWGQPSSALAHRLMVAPYTGFDLDASAPRPSFLVLERVPPEGSAPLRRPVLVLDWLGAAR